MKHFVRLIVVSLLAVALAGCGPDFKRFWSTASTVVSTVSEATVPGYVVIAAAQTFDGSQLAAAAFLRLPVCGSFPCRVRSATPIIKGAFLSGRIARDELKVQVRAACAQDFAAGRECTAGIPVASYNTLVAATRAIDDAMAVYRTATAR